MAAPVHIVADLQALIQMLQAQVAILQAAIPAAPAIGTAAVVTFAVTPQMLNSNDLLHYLTKKGSSIYEQGCKALDDKALTDSFGMTTDQRQWSLLKYYLVAPFQWDGTRAPSKSLPSNCGETQVDLIKCYRQINKM
jgi:hypothetical protein